LAEKYVGDREWLPSGSDVNFINADREVTEKYSKDDYTARLEAELKTLRGGSGNKSESMRRWSSSFKKSPREAYDE